MIEICNVKLITDKEAANLFPYSRAWFIKCREKKEGPPFIKMGNKKKSKVFYDKTVLERWFLKNSKE